MFFDKCHDKKRGSLRGAVSQSLYLRQCDLRCLVRTIYVLNTKVCTDEVDEDKIGQFWASELSVGLWAEAMAAVDSMTEGTTAGAYTVLTNLVMML